MDDPAKNSEEFEKQCKHPGCTDGNQNGGYCFFHFNCLRQGWDMDGPKKPIGRPRIYDPVCSVEGCNNPSKNKGLCGNHFYHMVLRPNTLKIRRECRPYEKESCKVEGCKREVKALGYCAAHYQRLRYGLDLETPIRTWTKRRERKNARV